MNRNSEVERNNVNNNRLKLNEIINQINNLRAQLTQLQDRQAAIQASIEKQNTTIATNDKLIADLKARIVGLQKQLRDLQDQSDTFSSQTRDLEVKVNRLRTDISVADTRKTKYLNDNAGYQDRIDIERRKITAADVVKLNGMVDSLKKMVPTIES